MLLFSIIFFPFTGMSQQADLPLLPKPAKIELNEGKLTIDSGFSVTTTGSGAAHLEQAVSRFINRLEKRTGIPLAHEQMPEAETAVLEILCEGEGEQVQSVRADESYTLVVTHAQARLTAPSPVGIFRGLETFLQLIDIDEDSYFVPSLEIEDQPRFPWRGLLIDVSRHFQTAAMIKKNLDAMAAVKMNVLHWHLSDDQGFRVESKSFPKLHLLGSDGNYYSRSEVREIVAYAHDLGIRVVPEFDMPGHSTSWFAGYPELAAAAGPYSIERKWGVFEPCMDPSKEELYEFLDIFVGEMAELFPDEYFHIGGDEVKAAQWNSNEAIRDFKKRNNLADNRDLQNYFNQRLLVILTRHGKKMIGWDEILNPNLPNNIVVQSWRGQASLASSARQGYQGILSFGYYLDHMRPASFHYEMDPLGNEASDLSAEEKSRILGGEACMWAEFVDSENIESRIWPRAAAIAERLWSPAWVNDIQDLYRRLELTDRQFQLLGLRHRSLYLEKLQRMAGSTDIQPLLIFADLLKPPILSVRKRARTYYSYTPLNRLVDTLMPESKVAREFSNIVESFLVFPEYSAENSYELHKYLNQLLLNDSALQSILDQSYILKEIQPLADTVAELSGYATEALSYLESRQKPTENWQQRASVLLEKAEEPQAEIFIAVLPAMKKLIEAAMALP